MTQALEEKVAARLWRAESEDAGAPASIPAGRTLEAFRDQREDTRARWHKFARAAIAVIREELRVHAMAVGSRSIMKYQELFERESLADIKYLMACAEAHADKFPDPQGMKKLVARLRSHFPTPPTAKEG